MRCSTSGCSSISATASRASGIEPALVSRSVCWPITSSGLRPVSRSTASLTNVKRLSASIDQIMSGLLSTRNR